MSIIAVAEASNSASLSYDTRCQLTFLARARRKGSSTERSAELPTIPTEEECIKFCRNCFSFSSDVDDATRMSLVTVNGAEGKRGADGDIIEEGFNDCCAAC